MHEHSDAGPDWVELRTAIIGLGESSQIKSYYPDLRRKVAELERFRVLLDASNDAVLLADAESGEVIDWNASAEAILSGGVALESRPTIGSLVPADVAGEILGVEPGAEWRRNVRLGPDGDRVFEASVVGVLFHERPYIVFVARDVTERTAAEDALRHARENLEREVRERTAELTLAMQELQAANEAKSLFLASMSHELRTPLNSIIGFSGLMLQGVAGPVDEEQHRQLEMISHAGKHLLNLINDLLDVSRIEAGKVSLDSRPTSAGALAEEVGSLLQPLADEKGIDLEVRIGQGDMRFSTDVSRAREVLLNLAGNAVKFTDDGSVTISVTREDEWVEFAISDTGPGIAPEDRERIWDHYRQLGRPKVNRGTEGTGLGLAISRGLAHVLGGEITLESEVGVGSTFTLRLPLECPSDSHEAPSE